MRCKLRYTLGMAALVYLETSIISYLTAWPSRDLIVAGRQQLTHEWWSRRRNSPANAEKRPLVEAVCRVAGYEAPILCTPDELMGEDSYVDAS